LFIGEKLIEKKGKNCHATSIKEKKGKTIEESIYLVKFTKLDHHNAMETLT
jgi:hypothetical protein